MDDKRPTWLLEYEIAETNRYIKAAAYLHLTGSVTGFEVSGNVIQANEFIDVAVAYRDALISTLEFRNKDGS